MKRKSFLLIFLSFFFLSNSLRAQDNNIVQVNQLTGTAIVNIPLYTLNVGSVSLPISLTYNATGVRALDVEGTAGMGWNLVLGGAVTRQLRGLPDDQEQDNSGADRIGWMNVANQATISSLSLTNDNNTTTYTDVATDMSHINADFVNYSDTEPDLFNVSAPGLSCTLVYDKTNSTFRTIPYTDVVVNYTLNSTSGPQLGAITSFTITNDKGIKYTFATPELSTQQASGTASGINFFKSTYNQYINGITYYSAWDLTSIADPNGNQIQLKYIPATSKTGFTTIPTVVTATPTNSATILPQYHLYGGTTPNNISEIDVVNSGGSRQAFQTSWVSNSSQKSMIASISGYGRNFQFTYTSYRANGITSTYQRNWLTSVTDQDCSSPFNYTFSYTTPDALPDSASAPVSTDLWGYYQYNYPARTYAYPSIIINPSTPAYDRYRAHGTETIPSAYLYTMPGADMSATSSNSSGSLTQISYANGGTTTLTYEPNDYYDNLLGANVNGSGIRVVSITDYDGINTANNMVRNYTYRDASSHSYGKPISSPIYAFTQPYSGTGTTANLWSYSTVRSTGDLSPEDHTILYTSVKESQTGKGSTVYNFSVPATAFDAAVTTPLAWSPTITNTGATTTAATGFLSNDKNTYPFPPNLNYDFERGLPVSIVKYNDAGNEVNEMDFTYATPQTPITITALKYDNNNFGVGYAKYNIYTTTAPLSTQVTTKTYDLGSTSLFHTVTLNNTYNSQNQVSQQSVQNSDGSIKNTYTKFTKDYVTTTRTDSYTQALYGLQQLNINVPVEKYTQVKPSGASSYVTTQASLVKFSSTWPAFTTAILPVQKLVINSAAGLSSFTPSTITSGNFVYDNTDYIAAENDESYDKSANLLTKSDNFKHVLTSFADHSKLKTVAQFPNARWNEVSYTDFDSSDEITAFPLTSSMTTGTGREGAGASLTANSSQTITLTRNTIATNYIFSIWVQSSAAGNITATVTGTGGTHSVTIPFANVTGTPGTYPTGWQYIEKSIPLTSITGSTITVSFSSSQNIIVDDILIYPDVSEATTYAYDYSTHTKTAETNTNGVSAYYQYDQFGRIRYTYDQDKNIVERNQYVSGVNAANYTNLSMSAPATGYANVQVWFSNTSAFNSCAVTGTTFTWDFGDGTTATNPDLSGNGKIYTANGTYTVKLTASSPLYGTRSVSQTIVISTLTATNITYSDPTTGTPHTGIATVVFKQGGVTKYTFNESTLGSGSVVPGTYTITITPTGSNYNSVTYTGPTPQCFPKGASSFTFTDNLTNTPNIKFTISSVVCAD